MATLTAPLQPAMETMTDVKGLSYDFSVCVPSLVTVFGHIDFEHRAVYGTADKAIMVAIDLLLNGSRVPGSVTGCNIFDRLDHYAVIPLTGQATVDPGSHSLVVRARSASTAAPGKNGLANVRPYSAIHIRVEPI